MRGSGSTLPRTRLGRAVPLLLLAFAVLGSACGGRLDKEEYERRVRDIGERFSMTLQRTFSSPRLKNARSLDEAGAVIRQGARTIRQGADRLAELKPPEEAQQAHDELVAGLRRFARDLLGFAVAAERGDLVEVQEFARRVQTQELGSMRQIRRALKQLRSMGYRLGA